MINLNLMSQFQQILDLNLKEKKIHLCFRKGRVLTKGYFWYLASFFRLSKFIYFVYLLLLTDISLQDKMVIYDNEKQQIGWVSSNCDTLPKFRPLLL